MLTRSHNKQARQANSPPHTQRALDAVIISARYTLTPFWIKYKLYTPLHFFPSRRRLFRYVLIFALPPFSLPRFFWVYLLPCHYSSFVGPCISKKTKRQKFTWLNILWAILILEWQWFPALYFQKIALTCALSPSAIRCRCPSASSLFKAQMELSLSSLSQSRIPTRFDLCVSAICSISRSLSASNCKRRFSVRASKSDGRHLPPDIIEERPVR